MINMLGEIYMSEKEASVRYGYSCQWFRLRRHKNIAPNFLKLEGKGKVYYSVSETDKWFKENMCSFNMI
jgi:hypothetical protein